MKILRMAGLLASHAALAVVGFQLAGKAPADPRGAERDPRPAVPASIQETRTEPASPNPILRAGAADFRAAWDEMILSKRGTSGEPHWNSLNFFVDWCAVDPEGAVRGLSRLYAPRFAHNYLSNGIGSYGAEMAPALAKHWREIRYLPDYKVEFALGKSLNALAKSDPEAAAGLTKGQPPGMRADIYSNLFSHLDLDAIRRTAAVLSAPPSIDGDEATRMWDAVADAVDAADSKQGIWDWLVRADHPKARRALVEEGMMKSAREENWGPFFQAVNHLDPDAQAEVREQFRERLSSGEGWNKFSSVIADQCRRNGIDDWSEGIKP